MLETRNQWTTVEVGGGAMAGYVARPNDDISYPGVLLFMEIFGVNSHMRAVADRVAAEGYVVMAPDLFHRTAPGVELGYDESGLARGIELVGQVSAPELRADVCAAFASLGARADTTEKVGAMGFCFGGHAAYFAACELPIDATVSFYGGGIAAGPMAGAERATVDLTPSIRGSILCLFGAQDGYIPPQQVEAIRGAFQANGTRGEVQVYDGVGHGFFCDVRDGFDRNAADDSWARLTALFELELH
ncbi:MAG: carboxymethylenebutenolidase [Hyphomicrobiaceae bacterium]|jgi:carboxymethylenebutenolidase